MQRAIHRRSGPPVLILMKIFLRSLATLCAFVCTELYAASNLSVTLMPSQAVSGGAQWNVDGGTWRNSGTTVTGLSTGSHTVSYKAITGWIAPASATVTLKNGGNTLTATYVQTATLKITLAPTSGQWRVDGGSWQASDATVSGLAPGNHSVDYAAVSGYISPASETVSLTAGQAATLTRNYVQLAQLTVTLTPASGQWRIDGGAWRNSGTTATSLAIGNHTVEYAALSGYTNPAAETVSLAAGQAATLSRSYVQLAQLSITLTPSSGQWRIDSGAWQASGTTVANLASGTHVVDYSSLTQYAAPASESVTLAAGQSLALNRSYTQLAQISISLVPSTGQWRANGGAWNPSGTSLFVLPGN